MQTKWSIKREGGIQNILWYCAICGKIEFNPTATEVDRFMFSIMSLNQLEAIRYRQDKERESRLQQSRERLRIGKDDTID